ncbi:MAG: hypothetical protein ACLGG0_05615 [Bacteriovoracia bacterium]
MNISKKQIQDAIALLDTPEGSKIGETKNFYFETSDRNFVFEIEKPSSHRNTLTSIISNAHQNGVIEILLKGSTGKNSEDQYFSIWPRCYIVKRSTGYKNAGNHYFDFS